MKHSFKWARGNPGNWINAGTADDCGPISGNTADLSGKVVLISLGYIEEHLQSALDLGAHYIMISTKSNANERNFNLELSPGFLGVGVISHTLGTKWLAALATGKVVTLDFTGIATSLYWRTSFEGNLEPSFSAPGGRILSTFPIALGSYAILSGTSMSCPLRACSDGMLGVAEIYGLVFYMRFINSIK
ncbi:hypothetical protein GGP41_006913 [Bipolaris sorokiniana]|uniref:Peptidase S8/S53 domain-containing protein n=1 Tax=Cochliobolus sativus TaxID=45130 RepID=A0A8H5ZTS0_COCSA|nr:hypothetical protein GGP41_006913 [Bipolaris sorokiniana]